MQGGRRAEGPAAQCRQWHQSRQCDKNADAPTGPGPQEVNQVVASAILTDKIINDPDVFSPFECNDVFTLSNDDNVATSLCCPVAQLSTLTCDS